MVVGDTVSGPKWVLWGFLFFTACNQVVRLLVPRSAMTTAAQTWKWKNTAVSLTHSLITGPWSLYCLYEHPKLGEDLIDTCTRTSHMLVSFSVGYFIHDFLDMALWHRKRSSYELMVHHACCISCFGLAVWSTRYMGYAVVALFVEVNSIFLHIRQLFIITGMSKKEPEYRFISMVNIGTFVVFRIAVLGWMTRWLVLHRDDTNLSLAVYTYGSVGLALMMLMNIILFLRICIVDFTKKKHKESSASSVHKKLSVDKDDNIMGAPSLLPPSNNLHLH